MPRSIILAMLAAIALVQGGCISASMTRNVTTGQELIDLQKAHEAGVINDGEYAELKMRMVSEAAGGGRVSFHSESTRP